jgi:hypothetical protein
VTPPSYILHILYILSSLRLPTNARRPRELTLRMGMYYNSRKRGRGGYRHQSIGRE